MGVAVGALDWELEAVPVSEAVAEGMLEADAVGVVVGVVLGLGTRRSKVATLERGAPALEEPNEPAASSTLGMLGSIASALTVAGTAMPVPRGVKLTPTRYITTPPQGKVAVPKTLK